MAVEERVKQLFDELDFPAETNSRLSWLMNLSKAFRAGIKCEIKKILANSWDDRLDFFRADFDSNLRPLAGVLRENGLVIESPSLDILDRFNAEAPYSPLDVPFLQRRDQLARTVLPLLKERIEQMSHTTIQDRKDIVKWTNQELRRLGLAVKCPDTGKEAFLAAPGERFAIEIRDKSHRRSYQTYYLDRLVDTLELMPSSRKNTNWLTRVQRIQDQNVRE
jgi:hypothetical protein